MTTRKFEKIKENILILQQINNVRPEKEINETPGPTSYYPSYNQIEENPKAVI